MDATTSVLLVGRLVDADDLWLSERVAAYCGWSSVDAVTVFRRRYADFPEPVIEHARCMIWLGADIREWRERHPARPRNQKGDAQ